LGIGGGGFMTGRGQANVLTRATAILAAMFFATSLALTIVANVTRAPRSILEGVTPPAGTSAPAVPTGQGSLVDQLKKMQQERQEQQQAPAAGSTAPAAPPQPEAPRSQ